MIDVNVDIVADSDDEHGILKPNELESACWRVSFMELRRGREHIVKLAVTLLSGIVQNHPFIEGNKRTALVAARALLPNGFDLEFSDEIEVGKMIKAFAAGHLEEADLEDAFETHLVSI